MAQSLAPAASPAAAHPPLPTPAPAAPPDRLAGLLVPLQTGGARPPFFCVHDLGGSVGRFQRLAALLGPDQPFYALRGRGREGRTPPDDDLPRMAADYLAAVRQVRPHGPYYLGGYCLGGMIAFEMGRLLRAAGEVVAPIMIFEGYAPPSTMPPYPFWHPYHWPAMLRNLPGWVADHVSLGPRYTWDRFRMVTLQLARQRLQRLGLARPPAAPDLVRGAERLPDHHQLIVLAHLRAVRVYKPPPSDLAVTLFAIRRQSMLRDPDHRRGWHRLALRGLTLRRIAGSHHNALEDQHVPSLAAALRLALDDAQASLSY
ncbi:MAG: hypothetical protein IT317_11830 [Anaerolineales bacterium]|nr:hypothetical protein [Anaerolineales bacterium]